MLKFAIGLGALAWALVPPSVLAHAGHAHHAAEDAASGHHAPARTFPPADSVAAPAGLTVSDCWIRALPNRLPAAAYFRMTNSGDQEAVLVGAEAPGFRKVMLHGHDEAGGMARMVHVNEVKLAPGEAFAFAPRGHHVMLEQAEVDLEVGTLRPITLWFEGPKALTVQCEVKAPGTMK